ncbi:MAG: GDP-mannose 4,6-dehydratase [Bryobacteraceae bacterium]
MPKALIIGCNGQDGAYLSELLQGKGYDLILVRRGGIEGPLSKKYCLGSLSDGSMDELLSAEHPDEIYYLAAFQNSAEDAPLDQLELMRKSLETNTMGVAQLVYGISRKSPQSRLFYAASSHVFGEPASDTQNEDTPLNPLSAYGVTKAAGVHTCRWFRKRHDVFASVGILYNHESPRRKIQFLSKKVVRAAVRIKRGEQDHLTLGPLDILVDWGFAPDYVTAMWNILQLNSPDDFIIATGTLHSVRNLVATAFEMLGVDWRKYVVEENGLLTKPPVTLCGDASKLRRATGWQPQTSFEEMIRIMVEAELKNAC